MLRIFFAPSPFFRLAALALLACLLPDSAWADDNTSVGGAMTGIWKQFAYLLPFVSAACYIGGINYSVQVLLRAYNYSQQTEKGIWGTGIIQRFFGAAALFSLPGVITLLQVSFFGKSPTTYSHTWGGGAATGDGLDAALVHMVGDVVPAMGPLIGFIAFFSGLMMVVGAVVALSNQGHMDDKINKKQIAARFFVGTLLMTFASSVGAMLNTVFGSATSNAVGTLAYDKAGMTAADGAQVDVVFNAIFAWLAMIGLIAILRGLWVLKNSLEDGSKGLTAPLTHLIAGAALVNIVPAIHMIQSTLGCDSGSACGILS